MPTSLEWTVDHEMNGLPQYCRKRSHWLGLSVVLPLDIWMHLYHWRNIVSVHYIPNKSTDDDDDNKYIQRMKIA